MQSSSLDAHPCYASDVVGGGWLLMYTNTLILYENVYIRIHNVG